MQLNLNPAELTVLVDSLVVREKQLAYEAAKAAANAEGELAYRLRHKGAHVTALLRDIEAQLEQERIDAQAEEERLVRESSPL